ncbi:MAG: hypothetical protein CMC66_03645 [Flavobacteriaceae bacterium]|nr:hypothetical protein [Flavobacteriaceae bacterium]
MSNKHVHAIYDDDDKLLSAVKHLRSCGVSIKDVFTPFPVHGLDHALDLKPTRIAIAAFIYGCIGLTTAILMINYIMIVDWPQNIGGKPSFSFMENLPAFVPVIFELTVFFAGHLMVITFYMRSSLWPFKKAENPIPETTDDKFLIQITSFKDQKKLMSIIKQTDYHNIDIIEHQPVVAEPNKLVNESSQVSVGFVFHSRKYSDGSSNLRIQFTKGRGSQYAKNTGIRIFRKYWSSSKNAVSTKHPEHEKINKQLENIKSKIIIGKEKFKSGAISFERLHNYILDN